MTGINKEFAAAMKQKLDAFENAYTKAVWLYEEHPELLKKTIGCSSKFHELHINTLAYYSCGDINFAHGMNDMDNIIRELENLIGVMEF